MVTIANVNSAMPVSTSNTQSAAVSPSPSEASASAPKTVYSDRVASAVATLASGAGSSLDDQISAYRDLKNMIFNGAQLYNAGNQDDLKSAINAFNNSDFAKRLETVSNRYTVKAMSGAGGPDNSLKAIDSFSSDDQKLLFVSLMGDANYDTVDDWKAGMAQEAAAYDPNSGKVTSSTLTIQQVAKRFGLTDANSVGGDTVTLSKDAIKALTTTPRAAPANAALTALTTKSGTVSDADVALSLLSAKPMTTEGTDVKDSGKNDSSVKSSNDKTPGSLLSVSA